MSEIKPPQKPHYIARRRVEFCETDMTGIVHFANFYRYMEQSEHEFFRCLGLKIAGQTVDGANFGWPRLSANCTFRSPAYYEDLVTIHVVVRQRSPKTLRLTYEFFRDDTLLAEGEMVTVYCLVDGKTGLKAAPMPDEASTVFDRLMATRTALPDETSRER